MASFLTINLEEDKARELATTLSNEKCRKIIDYLATHDSVTESQIAESLKMPLSTVHYNINKLLKNNIVKSDEFHYSKKGKEINHYSLANKYILISPKPVKGLKSKLKDVLPAILVLLASTGILRLGYSALQNMRQAETAKMPRQMALDATVQSTGMVQSATEITLWFLAGGLFAFAVYILISRIRRR